MLCILYVIRYMHNIMHVMHTVCVIRYYDIIVLLGVSIYES